MPVKVFVSRHSWANIFFSQVLFLDFIFCVINFILLLRVKCRSLKRLKNTLGILCCFNSIENWMRVRRLNSLWKFMGSDRITYVSFSFGGSNWTVGIWKTPLNQCRWVVLYLHDPHFLKQIGKTNRMDIWVPHACPIITKSG